MAIQALAGVLARSVVPFLEEVVPVANGVLPGFGQALTNVGKVAETVEPQAERVSAALSLPKAALEGLFQAAKQSVPGQGLQLFVSALRTAGEVAQRAAGLVTSGFQVLGQAMGAIQGQVASFVRLADPGAFLRFQLAADRLAASVGRSLAPLLDRLTLVVDKVGAAFDTLGGGGRNLVAGLAGAGVGLTAFAGVLGAVGAAVATLATGPGGLAALATAVGAAGLAIAFLKQPAAETAKLMDKLGTAFQAFAEAAGDALLEVGTALLPVAVSALKTLADVLRGLAPVVRAAGWALAGFVEGVRRSFDVLSNSARFLTSGPGAALLGPAGVFAQLTKFLARFLPEFGGGEGDKGKLPERGREPAGQYRTSSLQDFFRQTQEGALNSRSRQGPEQQAVAQRERMIKLHEDIKNSLDRLGQAFERNRKMQEAGNPQIKNLRNLAGR